MFKTYSEFIVIFVIITILLILFLSTFICIIIYRYQQKQHAFFKEIEAMKSAHENQLLQTQLEMQEQTFQHISREIHDNIGQKLTLAKLHLNTLNGTPSSQSIVDSTTGILSEAIRDLSDLSRSMSSEIILGNGLIKGIESEIEQLHKSSLYNISFRVTGDPVFLTSDVELVMFRITQEAINNIIKHACASNINIHLHYLPNKLKLEVKDNGKGFSPAENISGTGLANIRKRTLLLEGQFQLDTLENNGTSLQIEIPIHEPEQQI